MRIYPRKYNNFIVNSEKIILAFQTNITFTTFAKVGIYTQIEYTYCLLEYFNYICGWNIKFFAWKENLNQEITICFLKHFVYTYSL